MSAERQYEVTWVIEVGGESFEDAAHFVRDIQLDPTNIATIYHVRDQSTGEERTVDTSGG